MNDQTPNKLTFAWHLGNGLLGAIIAAGASFAIVFLLVGLAGQPIGGGPTVLIFAIAICFSIVFVAKRVARHGQSDISLEHRLVFGAGFHLGNILIGAILAIVLSSIPAFVIPHLARQFGEDVLMFTLFPLSMTIYIIVHTFASIRAAKSLETEWGRN